MPSIGASFFILGLVVASIRAETATVTALSDTGTPADVTPSIASNTTMNITSTTSIINAPISNSTMNMNVTNTNSTSAPSTTQQTIGTSSKTSVSQTPVPTPGPNQSTTKRQTTTPKPQVKSPDNNTGIIILVVIIIIALVFGVACYLARRRGRQRYSVDFTSRPDEANIPLSTVEPELQIDAVPQNGLQTFESVEATTTEPQEPEAKPDEKEEQKAEPDKSAADPSAESAPLVPPPDSTGDKPKEDVAEQSPTAPVEEKTDDEGAVSNKTSVESLKEANENNSNNADLRQQRELKSSNPFWDIPLDCPV